ncbi:hypothetical protein CVM73_28155 [Bradyrhizobium forestalis]|uniref:Trimeric autotransporter adhesin YadA-like head domain-containing protein n=1 Tax=Bradyrhizobium forestalis TaxID=1419263 RepID=A0A2M8R2J1_9BRAD|nr:YadA-like family protein [Bradyrhizobium forestalis]PJG52042.1 hypothetical protein CVM73_28155 [Bradyrhizobium forestalis]
MHKAICSNWRAALLSGLVIITSGILTLGLPPTPALAGCNSGSNPNTDLLSSFNCQALATGANSLAVGNNALAVGGSENTSLGTSAITGGLAAGSFNTAVGYGAFGGSFGGSGNNTAIGANTAATGGGSIAIGGASTTDNAASAGGQDSIAIGINSNAGTADGDGVPLTQNSIAIGTNSNAAHTNSTAIGAGATTTRANQVMMGTGSTTYTTPGITSAASKAVQTGPLQFVTSDAGGNLAGRTAAELGLASAGDVAGVNSQINAINTQLSDINNRLSSLSTEARRGIAAAAALAPLITPSAPGRTTFSFSTGFYRGQTGASVGFAHRLQWSTPLIVHGSYSNGGGGEHIGRVGFAAEF